jgi:SAM-dependent methyltransferase
VEAADVQTTALLLRIGYFMTNLSDNIRVQAEHHPLEFTGRFRSLEEYCLHLIHLKAYEEAAALAINKTVLDLGCNNGYGTAVLASNCAKVIGLDVSPTAIEDAQQRFENYGINFLVFDGLTIPFDDHCFDMIVSFQVIEHIAELAKYLTEIVRVLVPEGLALFTTPNAAIRLDRGMKPWNQFHVREYRADELSALLQPVFATVAIQGLFADEDFYRVEFERCQGALEFARRRNSWRLAALKYLRDTAITFSKALLPTPAIDYIRMRRNVAVAGTASEQMLDPNIMKRYSTRDVFYSADNLDKALDLIAVCKVS